MQQALQVPPVFRVYQAVLKDAHVFMLPEARQHTLGVTPTLQCFIQSFDTHMYSPRVRYVICGSNIITPGKRPGAVEHMTAMSSDCLQVFC